MSVDRNRTDSTGPRIYNLHPRLAGAIANWPAHLDRIAGMGFDTVYINAFFRPGASGSLYAIADPYELHPVVRGDAAKPARDLVEGFVREARSRDLRVMTDLVLPRTANDGRLVHERPEWLRRHHDGTLVQPQVADPRDPHKPKVMADLAELALDDERHAPAMLDYFEELAAHYLELGIGGFRCSTAYQVPPAMWSTLIGRLKERFPGSVYLAAALGCPFERVMALEGCGFDLIFDSSCWWNLHDRWYLDQVARLRAIAATIAFPEDHNSGRRAANLGLSEPHDIERHYRARWLVASGLGSGVMMPMGYEYGCTRPLDPVHASPMDWEEETRAPRIDITKFVAESNGLRAAHTVLSSRGPLRRVTAPNSRIVGLMRLDAGSPVSAAELAFLVVNADPAQSDGTDVHSMITASGGRFESFEDVTPGVPALGFSPSEPLTLDPEGVRLFISHARTSEPAVERTSEAAKASKERLLELARTRIAIEKVTPELDGGRFAVKRVIGEVLEVEADIFSDGHDKIAADLLWRAADERDWQRTPMTFFDNDRWTGSFPLPRNIRYVYTIEAWRDVFASWRYEVTKKHDADVPIALELREGRDLVKATAANGDAATRSALEALHKDLEAHKEDDGYQLARLLDAGTAALMRKADLKDSLSRYDHELEVIVDRTAAAFAAWYELFPRSQADDPTRHGTFDDVIAKLPYVKAMGFDVLYFPPIHPIGMTNRKGRNNSLRPQPGDPGSPYAIGSSEGGHEALHPELGGFEALERLRLAAHEHGLELAMDYAIQCSPDHPWLEQHPQWFDWRPDGSLRYAENPPKKYEDITNVSFYREGALPSLWLELRDVVLFWIDKGIKIFRVDNPHTKPYPFWEWLIRDVQERHPDAVFLAEAFTRPKVMRRLAKIGFTQSYSYFTWRNEKAELIEYLTELTRDEPREHMRPNFFVNTPDINPRYLQSSGRAGFQVRAVLASTLSTLWGVYSGFELCEGTPVPGKEEYLNSEKYEIKAWDWDRAGHIREDIANLNRIRLDNPALWQFVNLEFHNAWNDHILVYSKSTDSLDNVVLIAVNLDPHHAQGAHFEVPLWTFGLADHSSIEVEDLITGSRFTWAGKVQHIWLDPAHRPYGIWRLMPPGLPH